MIEVSTGRELVSALSRAQGGDTIVLAAGSYSSVTLKGLNFSTPVTITSADPSNPAVLSDFSVTSVSGLTIQNVAVTVGKKMGMTVGQSENIVIDHIDVAGPSSGKPGGNGLKIDKSTDVVVTNSSFHDLGYGLTHVDSKHVTISGNSFENIRVDGIRGGGTSFIEISGNSLRNFFRDPGEHGDAIQFWTKGTTGSAHDIVVKDNLIERGEGNRMQGIFFGDESRGKQPYIDVEITGNTILGTGYNGINLYPAKGAVISGNTVVGYHDMKAWIRVDGSTNVQLYDNIATEFSIPANGNTNLVRTDNQVVDRTTVEESAAYIAAHYAGLPPQPGRGDLESFNTAIENVLGLTPAAAAELSWRNALAQDVSDGLKSAAQTYAEIVELADNTTSVGQLTYQFFMGHGLAKSGIEYFVSPTGPNPNNLNSAYFQDFQASDRYINFAIAVGVLGEGRPGFEADYGALSLADSTKRAYEGIFGGAPSDAKVAEILDSLVSSNGQSLTRAEYFALYGGDGPAGLGTKAAMVGYLLHSGITENVGIMAKSVAAYLTDLADGAAYGVDIIATYGRPEWDLLG